MLKYLISIVFLCSWVGAEQTKTVYNPHTSNLDYITALTTNTISAGTNITVSTTASGVSIAATNSGGDGGIVSPATFTWTNPFGMSMSTLTVTSMTSGSVNFSGASGKLSQDNSNLYYDAANVRLGVGTNSPTHTVDVISYPNTTPMRIGYDNVHYMDITTGAYFDMNANGVIAFRLFNGNPGYIGILSNGDNVMSQTDATGLNRLIVNGGGVGFRVGDIGDAYYLDYISGGLLAAFRAYGLRPLHFGTNGIDALFISAYQNVGIGCEAPSTKLHISSGTVTIDGNVSPALTITGSGAPPNSQALCLLAGSLGHCTSIVGVGGGCTCSVP